MTVRCLGALSLVVSLSLGCAVWAGERRVAVTQAPVCDRGQCRSGFNSTAGVQAAMVQLAALSVAGKADSPAGSRRQVKELMRRSRPQWPGGYKAMQARARHEPQPPATPSAAPQRLQARVREPSHGSSSVVRPATGQSRQLAGPRPWARRLSSLYPSAAARSGSEARGARHRRLVQESWDMDWEMPGRQPRDADFDDAFNATSFLTADSGVSMGTGPPVSTSSADSGLASDGLRMATASVPEPTPTALIPSPARHQPTAEPGARSASHPGSVASEDVYRSEAVYSTALAGEASRFFAGQSTSSESGQQSIFSPAAVPTTLPAPTPSSSFAPDSSPQPAVEPTVLTTANISLINPKGVYRIDVDAAGDLVLFNSSHPAIHDAVDLTLTDSHIESNGSLTLFDRLDRLDRPRSMPTRVRIENSTLTAGDNLVLFNDKMMRGNMVLEIAKTSHLVAQKGYVALIENNDEAPSAAQDKSDHPVVLNISIQESAMNAPQGGVFAVPGVVANGAPRSLVVSINSSNLTAGNGPNQFAGAMKSENQQVPLHMHFAIHNSRLEAEKGFVHVISAAVCNTRVELDVSGSHFSARNGAETALIGRIAEDGNQLDLSMKISNLMRSRSLLRPWASSVAAITGSICTIAAATGSGLK